MIDTLPKALYKAALLAAVALAIVLPGPAHAGSKDYKLDMGATLPRWVKKLEPHRYRSPWDWTLTKKWLDRTYGRWEYPRIRIVNKPGIKAFHLKNRKKRGDWDGINVYQLATGEVRLYVVARAPKEGQPAKKKKTGK